MSHKKGLSLKIKSFVGILVMSVVFCAAAVAASTYVFSDTNESLFKKHAENIAYTAANADAENTKKITDMVLETFKTVNDDEIITSDDWGSPEFEMFLKRFEWITKTPETL